jgi:hypothetical protein
VTTQTPAEHTSPFALQFVHDAPPVPHVAVVIPVWQVPVMSQHPAHVEGPHAAGAQNPIWQDSPLVAQSAQATPSSPHAVFWAPSAQTPFWQHPAHEAGPHKGMQVPFTHWAPPAHDWQTSPFAPHDSASTPAKHVLPSAEQHPEQLDGLQAAPSTHTPAEHCVPGRHAEHASPPEPHAESFPPGRHRFPWQQPRGHEAALHAPVVWHTLAMHDAVVPQS